MAATKLNAMLAALRKHDERVNAFYNDPMTAAYGCPTEDFQHDFDVKERGLLCDIVSHAKRETSVWKMACTRLEKWMP